MYLSWPRRQADMIMGFKNIEYPHTTYPPLEILYLSDKYQYHGRWTDTSLVTALDFLDWYYGKMIIQYGGRNFVTNATWVKFYRGNNSKPGGMGDLVFIIWLHDDEDELVNGEFWDMKLCYHPSMCLKDNGEEEDEAVDWADDENEVEEVEVKDVTKSKKVKRNGVEKLKVKRRVETSKLKKMKLKEEWQDNLEG